MTNEEKSKLQKIIVDSLGDKPHGRLLLAPRVGKSRIGILIIKKLKPKSILWVTPNSHLAKKDLPEEFIKWKAKTYLKNTKFITWASLNKVKGKFDLIILDEEHFITERNSKNLIDRSLSGNIISMTGTPTKIFKKNELYKRLGLEILYEIDINEAVDIGLLSEYKINVINVSLNMKKNILIKTRTGKSFNTSEFEQYRYYSRLAKQSGYSSRVVLSRRRTIQNSLSKLQVTKDLLKRLSGKILIFASTIKQAKELCEYTYHSKTDDKDLIKFQNNKIDRIAMVESGGTGFTYTGIDHLILVQADSNRNGQTSQKIARTLLKQKDYYATVWVICLNQTVDYEWVMSTLNDFDFSKIEFIDEGNIRI